MALMENMVAGVELSLPHQSLGDTYIELISDVLKDLPNVVRLDLRDNRLTDVGVQEIVQAICSIDGHRGVEVTVTTFQMSNEVFLGLQGVPGEINCTCLCRPYLVPST